MTRSSKKYYACGVVFVFCVGVVYVGVCVCVCVCMCMWSMVCVCVLLFLFPWFKRERRIRMQACLTSWQKMRKI